MTHQSTPETRRNGLNLSRLVMSLYLPGVLLYIGVGLVAPIVPVYAKSFGVSFGLASLVVTATYLGRTVTDIPAGMVADRVGRRLPVLASPLLVAIAALFNGLATSFPELILWRFVEGIGLAFWEVSRRTILMDEVPREMRARVVSTYLSFVGLGTAIGPVVGGIVATSFGIRAAFFSYSFVSMLSFIGVFLFLKESWLRSMGNTRPRFSLNVLSQLGPLKLTFVIVTVGFMLNTFRYAANQTLFPLFGKFDLNLSVDQIGFALGLVGLVQLLTRFPAGVISDRYGRKKAMVPSQVFSGIGAAGMLFAYDYTSALIVMGIAGLGSGFGGGSITAVIGDIAPESSRGAFIGVLQTLIDVAQMTGPLMLGFMADYYGLRLPFLVAGVALLISAITIQFFTVETLTYDGGERILNEPITSDH